MADAPAWYSKPLQLTAPAGLAALALTLLLGAAGAGGVGAATRDGDLEAVDARIAEVREEVRREAGAAAEAADLVAVTRYEEILRRLDRIERRMDGYSSATSHQ